MRALRQHLAFVLGWSVLFALTDGVVAQAFVSVALFLAAFACFHDATHGALGIPNRSNDALLFVTGRFLLCSAHAQRRLHLRHHARPLAHDDVEGTGAGRSFFGACAACLPVAGRMHTEGARGASPRIAHWIAAEHVFSVATILLALASPTSVLAVYVFVALTLQLTMSVWASHVPHHPPRALLAVGARLLWTRSPVVTSAVLHREHHARPKIPGRELVPFALA